MLLAMSPFALAEGAEGTTGQEQSTSQSAEVKTEGEGTGIEQEKPETSVNAAKIGENVYPTVAKAIDAANIYDANSDVTIVMLHDVTENIEIHRSLTLDLGGFKLSGDGTKTVTVRLNYNFDSGVKIETFATQSIALKDSSSGMPYKAYAFLNSSGYLQACFGYLSGGRIYAWPFDSMTYTRYKKDGSIDASGKYSGGFLATGGYSCNLPVFTSNDDLKNYLKTGDDSACINKSRKNNYIDTDDEYGWASTADISPSDLAAANPDAAENLVDKDVTLNSLIAAINALKQKLEEENPNKQTGGVVADPVPYPDSPTYTVIVNEVIKDPDIFPDSSTTPDPVPSADPGIAPGTDQAPETDKMLNYSGFLNTIIGLLRQILQAIKDILAFLKEFFVLDPAVVKTHALDVIQNIPAFDGFLPVVGYIDQLKGAFSDSYDYPKITMQTPDILVPYVGEQILLIDFQDYAKYFLWVRTFLAFSISFGFVLWVVKQFKVVYTVN